MRRGHAGALRLPRSGAGPPLSIGPT
jgi:hypothetical protein